MILRTSIAIAILSAASVAIAQPAEQPASDVAAAANADSEAAAERKVCRTEKATGSLTRRTRICLTPTQWREVNDRTRRGIDEMTGSASGGKECILDERGGCR